MHRTSRPIAYLAAIALVTFTACPNNNQAEPKQEDPPTGKPVSEIEITVDDGIVDAPSTVAGGPVKVSFDNSLAVPVALLFGRLHDDVDDSDAVEALDEGPEAVIEVASIAGGFPPTDPEEQTGATITFPEGRYFAAAFESGDNFEPAFFDVENTTAGPAEEPEAQFAIQTHDFRFTVLGDVPAIEATLLIENMGAQSHEVVITKGKGAKEKTVAEFLAPVPRVGKMWVPITLEPGSYNLACYIPDPRNGKPHSKLGMVGKLTVAPAI